MGIFPTKFNDINKFTNKTNRFAKSKGSFIDEDDIDSVSLVKDIVENGMNSLEDGDAQYWRDSNSNKFYKLRNLIEDAHKYVAQIRNDHNPGAICGKNKTFVVEDCKPQTLYTDENGEVFCQTLQGKYEYSGIWSTSVRMPFLYKTTTIATNAETWSIASWFPKEEQFHLSNFIDQCKAETLLVRGFSCNLTNSNISCAFVVNDKQIKTQDVEIDKVTKKCKIFDKIIFVDILGNIHSLEESEIDPGWKVFNKKQLNFKVYHEDYSLYDLNSSSFKNINQFSHFANAFMNSNQQYKIHEGFDNLISIKGLLFHGMTNLYDIEENKQRWIEKNKNLFYLVRNQIEDIWHQVEQLEKTKSQANLEDQKGYALYTTDIKVILCQQENEKYIQKGLWDKIAQRPSLYLTQNKKNESKTYSVSQWFRKEERFYLSDLIEKIPEQTLPVAGFACNITDKKITSSYVIGNKQCTTYSVDIAKNGDCEQKKQQLYCNPNMIIKEILQSQIQTNWLSVAKPEFDFVMLQSQIKEVKKPEEGDEEKNKEEDELTSKPSRRGAGRRTAKRDKDQSDDTVESIKEAKGNNMFEYNIGFEDIYDDF